MNLPPTAYIAFGTIAAALITGAITFVNIIIAKDQKTSEFRQQWIDSIREDLAAFCSLVELVNTHALYFVKAIECRDDIDKKIEVKEFIKSISNEYQKANNLYHRIILRLNPEEHQELITRLTYIEEYVEGKVSKPKKTEREQLGDQVDQINHLIRQVVDESRVVLKKEWVRVRSGETGYKVTKYSSLGLIAIALIAIILYVIFGNHGVSLICD